MAATTTQQPEGALFSEKPLQTTLSSQKDGPNGSLEPNGHTSPRSVHQEADLGNVPMSDGETPHGVGVKLGQNEHAFSANQALPRESADGIRPAENKQDSNQGVASEMNKVNVSGAAAPADADMPDAPADTAPEEKALEQVSSESQPQPGSEVPEKDLMDADAGATDEPAAHPTDSSSAPEPSSDSVLPKAKEDVAMEHAQDQAEPAMAADAAESTQETALSDVSPITPSGHATVSAAEARTDDIDASAGSPPPPATADTSMSEGAQPSAKVSRERDVDSEDEPVAKRTKVEHAGDQVEVRTGPEQSRLDVGQQAGAGATLLYQTKGQPRKLNDDSLNDQAITEWQNKQVRAVLAGVKKTKVGHNFRLPVETLWPQLWNEYSARVSNPVDINTMEKRLRGDFTRYATMGDFKADLDLMVQNAVTFNGETHDVTQQARRCREEILTRMGAYPAVEPAKPEKKESVKAHTTRHVEPRAAATPASAATGGRAPKAAAPSPSQKPVVESPAFAIPANNNGVPLIRRDSTKPDSRAKRPVKPAHSKDLVYDTKRKKKLPLDLRFCDELLTELRKTKHYDINGPFMQPVDPVALNIPTYHKVIKKPMDLGTMANKLAAGEYTTAKEFEKDFDLIIKNCRTFNGEDHVVYAQALRLLDLYRAEMSKKEEWMAKHAPVSTAISQNAASPRLKDESDEDEADSEADAEGDEEYTQLQHRLATIQKRLEEEQKKVNDMVNSGTAEITDVEIAQSVVAMLQKQLMQERAKMANLAPKKAGKAKPSKSKKVTGVAAVKKASVAGPSGGAAKKGGSRKAAPKRKISPLEREMVMESLGNLSGLHLEKVIQLIKQDTGQGENDAGELELDPDSIPDATLIKLYDVVIQAFPNLRAEKEKAHAQAAASDQPAAAKPKAPSKSKKNKPMSKVEQERRIQQLNELRAQAGRQASGSQEPMESIEGNGTEPVTQPEHESEDEVSSEEE